MNIMTNEQICEMLGWERDTLVGRGQDKEIWMTSDENPVLETPPFHESLDACFKYIVL